MMHNVEYYQLASNLAKSKAAICMLGIIICLLIALWFCDHQDLVKDKNAFQVNSYPAEVMISPSDPSAIIIGPHVYDFVKVACVTNVDMKGNLFMDYCDPSPIIAVISLGDHMWEIRKKKSIWAFYRGTPLDDSILRLVKHE